MCVGTSSCKKEAAESGRRRVGGGEYVEVVGEEARGPSKRVRQCRKETVEHNNRVFRE